MPKRKRMRLFKFEGTDKEYVIFLESELLEAQCRFNDLQSQVQTETTYPEACIDVNSAFPTTKQVLAQPHQPRFKIVIEDPSTQPAAREPIFKTIEFWSALPRDEDGWARRRKQTQTSTSSDLVRLFGDLTLGRLATSVVPPRVPESNALAHRESFVGILRGYGGFVTKLGDNKLRVTQLFNFGTFVFVSLSIVALHLGVPKEEVDECLKKYLEKLQGHSNVSSTYLSHLRHTVLRLIAWAAEMEESGLAHRAWELLFQYIPSIHTTPKVVEEKARADPVAIPRPPHNEVQADFPFDIPFLVKIIYGEACSLDIVNQGLKTNLQDNAFEDRLRTLEARIMEASTRDPMLDELPSAGIPSVTEDQLEWTRQMMMGPMYVGGFMHDGLI